jgi:hypothetical protein
MMEARQIWACADQLITMHGVDAGYIAALRADELLMAGQIDEHRCFVLVLDRIRQLEVVRPTGRTN